MKRSSKVLKSFIVPGLLVFSLVASVSAQGLDIRRYQRVPPTPIMPPTRPMLPTPIMPPTPIQDPSCVTPPSGLVGWWKGDGNTLDSVLGNNGVAQNITYTNGVVGQAFACDPNNFPYGTYTGIQIPDQPAYVLTNSLSIEGWVRPRGDGYCIFWRGDNRPGMDPYFIGMSGNNDIKFQICDQDGNTVTVGTYLTYNQWTHVAATLDGSTGTMSIYTNGVLADQTVTAVRPFGDLIPEDSPGVGIGNLNDGENNFPFTGDIDEISLYNRALTTAEIQSIYNASSAGKCPPSCTPAPSGLVGWWPGEGNANDIVGMNNGLLENVTFTSGVVGQAFACDPNNFPYGTYTGIQIPDQQAYVLTNSLSIEGWIRPRGDGYCIFWRGDNRPGLDPYVLSMQGNNNLRFYIEDESGNFAFVGTNINYNQWYHVAATWDGESGIMKLYINGQLASQTVTAVRPFGDLIPEDSPGVGIGNLNDGQNNFPFTGDIDEISLYNRALTAAEVQAIYNAGSAGKCAVACVSPPSGLVSWWPGEGNANDIMGNNNGFLQGGINFTAGEVGQAFNFDGVDDGISVPASSSLNVGAGQGMTLECWIAPTSVANQEPLMEWSGNGGSIHNGVHFWLSVTFAGVGGPGCIYANIVDSVGGLHIFASPTGIVQAGILQHVALTYDKASGVGKIYYNGSLVSSGNLGSFTPKTDTSFLLGRRMDFGDLNYQGVIDESAIFNRALSSNEIAAIYNAGSAGKCTGPLPPGIAVQPVNQTTVEGSSIVLSVVAGGTGPSSYQWSFNGTNIFGATNATLTLTNLHPNQSGNYAVTITTPYGSITSSNASVTVIAQNILVYKYAGIQKIITSGLALSYAYAGQMFFIPDNTNGVFVGWATIKGKKQYWVNPLPEYLWITISGVSNQSFTVLGQAGQGIDTNGYPNIWADLHKGQNTVLTIGKKKYFSFPNTFASDATHVYPDSQTGNLVLSESSSIYTFVPQSTQTANNTGQTLADLVNSLTKSLASQGYQTQ
jgi:hypothetical protein